MYVPEDPAAVQLSKYTVTHMAQPANGLLEDFLGGPFDEGWPIFDGSSIHVDEEVAFRFKDEEYPLELPPLQFHESYVDPPPVVVGPSRKRKNNDVTIEIRAPKRSMNDIGQVRDQQCQDLFPAPFKLHLDASKNGSLILTVRCSRAINCNRLTPGIGLSERTMCLHQMSQQPLL